MFMYKNKKCTQNHPKMAKICIFEAKTSIFVPSDHPNPLKNTFLTPLVCAFKKFLKKLFLGVLAIFESF